MDYQEKNAKETSIGRETTRITKESSLILIYKCFQAQRESLF